MTQSDLPQPALVWQNRPAQHRRAIYLCADEKFVPYSLFLAHQIAAAHPERRFDICIVSAAPISHHPLFDELNIRLLQIDTGAMEGRVLVSDRIGYAAYLRVFMPRLWYKEYDRLLYLDGDVFYQRGDLDALLDHPIADLALAAVPDCRYWGRPQFHADDLRKIDAPNVPYFNSGVLLIDVPKFVERGYADAVMQLIMTRGKDLHGHDQTTLNVVFANAWAELPVQWNYQYHYTTMLWSSFIDVCLYHFVGTRKPFHGRYGGNARRFTTPYRNFLKTHFPPLDEKIFDGLGGPKRWGMILIVVLYNLRKLKGVMHLEAKFSDDFDIRPISKSQNDSA